MFNVLYYKWYFFLATKVLFANNFPIFFHNLVEDLYHTKKASSSTY